MADFVAGLGRSKAISSYIQGIYDIRQKAMEEERGKQAVTVGNLAIEGTKLQTAINKHTYEKMQKEEDAANRLFPVDPILSQLTPSVKNFWMEMGQPYLTKGASGGNYVRMKDAPTIMAMMRDPMFNKHTGELAIEDLNRGVSEIQTKIQAMTKPDEEGKAPKVDEKMMEALKTQLADKQKKILALDQSMDVNRMEMEKENTELLKAGYLPENIGKYRTTGRMADLGSPGVQKKDRMTRQRSLPGSKVQDEESFDGVNWTPVGEPYSRYKSTETTDTDKDDKMYSRILSQSSSDAWRRTQTKYPKSGLSFNFTTGEMTTGGGEDPAALGFYEEERNKTVRARLKKVGLFNKYGDLHAASAKTTSRDITPAVAYLKSARDRNDALKKTKALSEIGWTEEELIKIIDQSGWK